MPDTVTGWHRAGFRFYWRWRSRPRGGRPRITDEIRSLIQSLASENPDWGAPRFHGELQKLGFVVLGTQCSPVSCAGSVAGGTPPESGLRFLQNHREVIVAMDSSQCRR